MSMVSKLTKDNVTSANLTLREELVMMSLAEGLSVAEIVKRGNIVALEGRRQPVCRQRIWQIADKAARKMRQRGLLDDR